MAEFEKIEERFISGKGLLIIPENKRKMRYYVLYADMVRIATNYYANYKWNPGRGLLARLHFRRNSYTISMEEMVTDRQAWDFVNDPSGQVMIAVKCAYEGTLQSFVNLATGAGLAVVSVTDLIKDYENLSTIWDEVLVSCESNFAIQLRLYGMPYDTCKPEKDKSKRPTPPPPPAPRVPPGTPIGDISPPYFPPNSDGGLTDPNEIDEQAGEPEELPGGECVLYSFDLYLQNNTQEAPVYNSSWIAFGEVSLIFTPNPSPSVLSSVAIRHKGLSASYNPPPSSCDTSYQQSVVTGSFGLVTAEIRNFSVY